MADPVRVARDLAKLAGGEFILIGGVATQLHVQRRPLAGLPLEATHDADAALSAHAMGIIRDVLPTTPNDRLHKEQVVMDGIDVDLYPQFKSRLRFNYDDLAPYAQRYRGFQIAAIPHLILLKVDAIKDRGPSEKGAKDRRDTAKLLVLLHGSPQARALLQGLATGSDLRDLAAVVRSDAFMKIVKGNSKAAAQLRNLAETALTKVSS